MEIRKVRDGEFKSWCQSTCTLISHAQRLTILHVRLNKGQSHACMLELCEQTSGSCTCASCARRRAEVSSSESTPALDSKLCAAAMRSNAALDTRDGLAELPPSALPVLPCGSAEGEVEEDRVSIGRS